MSKNAKLLKEFTVYCKKNPTERFWQALRNWSEYGYIWTSEGKDALTEQPIDAKDTFSKEGL